MWQRGRNLQDGFSRFGGCVGGYPVYPFILPILIQTKER